MRLSIVTTIYSSHHEVLEFYKRARAAADQITRDVEMIFVDDGTQGTSLGDTVRMLINDPCVRVIELSRNFGHHRAMMTGMMHAKGDLVFLIDSDLREDPALLVSFYQRLVETGADVVFGFEARRPGWRTNLGHRIHDRVYALLSDAPLHDGVPTIRLMTADYVHSLVQHKEREISLAGLWATTGFHQIPIPISTACGRTTKDSVAHKVKTQVDAVTSYSNKPLVYIFYIGAAIFTLSSLAAAYLIVDRIFFRVFLGGWPSIIVSIWMLGGLTIFSLGLLGIYISKIFTETKQRPYTIIRKVYSSESPSLTSPTPNGLTRVTQLNEQQRTHNRGLEQTPRDSQSNKSKIVKPVSAIPERN
jgi:putative glycosyltransferase